MSIVIPKPNINMKQWVKIKMKQWIIQVHKNEYEIGASELEAKNRFLAKIQEGKGLSLDDLIAIDCGLYEEPTDIYDTPTGPSSTENTEAAS
jgi:hypothetical protein